MFYLLSVVILIAVIKLLNETGKPLLCAGIYAVIQLFFDLLLSYPLLAVIIGTLVNWGYLYLWFNLLSKYNGAKWFAILSGGLILSLFLRYLLLPIL